MKSLTSPASNRSTTLFGKASWVSGLALAIQLSAPASFALAQQKPKANPPAAQTKSTPKSTAKPTTQPAGQSSATAKPTPAPTKTQSTAAPGTYVLQHRMNPGEVIRTRTTQVANTHTRVQGHEDISQARTISDKAWEVKSVSPSGEMTFEYRIEAVDMSQKRDQEEEVHFNSRTDKEVPSIFKGVVDVIAKPVATVTIDGTGKIIERDNGPKTPPLGMGDMALPLPTEPIAIGGTWEVPREMRIRLEDKTQKTFKLRELYTLEKVSAGVATISVETQSLTPIPDSSVEAQLCQQLSKGTIKFDIDKGQLISKELNWDHDIVGFRGADTAFKYVARFTEETIATTAPKTATRPVPKKN